MGCVISCRSKRTFHGVRVVHINGYVEEYSGTVKVGELTGKPPRLVCFSPAQLLSFAPRPFAPDHSLEPGRLYFLLPHTVFRSDSSPVDLASLVTRLTALARNGGVVPATADSKWKLPRGRGVSSSGDQHVDAGLAGGSGVGGQYPCIRGGVGEGPLSTVRFWKPILDTIEEKSFGRSARSLSTLSSSC